jgi:hypothetical protein
MKSRQRVGPGAAGEGEGSLATEQLVMPIRSHTNRVEFEGDLIRHGA